jgi:hypothetical protein
MATLYAMRSHASFRIVLVLAIVSVGWWLSARRDTGSTPPVPTDAPSAITTRGERLILDAFRERRSEVWVEAEGIVQRTLADDLEGSRHQRFIVQLASGHTVLVSHNIDLARRVSLQPDDEVAFRGQYEWNVQGGVVHWTHHDPRGRLEGGWIRHQGTLYR